MSTSPNVVEIGIPQVDAVMPGGGMRRGQIAGMTSSDPEALSALLVDLAHRWLEDGWTVAWVATGASSVEFIDLSEDERGRLDIVRSPTIPVARLDLDADIVIIDDLDAVVASGASGWTKMQSCFGFAKRNGSLYVVGRTPEDALFGPSGCYCDYIFNVRGGDATVVSKDSVDVVPSAWPTLALAKNRHGPTAAGPL